MNKASFSSIMLAILLAGFVSTRASAESLSAEQRRGIERAQSMMRLALQSWKNGEIDEAANAYQRARQLAPHDARTSFALAHFRFAQGQYATAAGLLREGMSNYPQWANLDFDLSLLFPQPQDFFSQREKLSKFVAANAQAPNVEDARFLLAYVYFFSGKKAESVSLIQSATWTNSPRGELAKMQTALAELEKKKSRASALAASRPVRIPKPPISIAYLKTGSPSAAMQQWYPTILTISKRYRLNPKLVAAVIHVESRFNPWAISPRGARGMMQLIPETANRFGVRNIHDPQQNIEGGVRYLRFLLDTFGDPALALAGYNAGENNVLRYGGIPPFSETQNYVQEVLAVYRSL